jgi:hypothetical protein
LTGQPPIEKLAAAWFIRKPFFDPGGLPMNELHPELRTPGGPPMAVQTHRLIWPIAAIRKRMIGSASGQRTRSPIGTDREAGVLIRFASESDIA